jgi:uncharacterized protein involved in cysteine biosynthesis
MTNEQDTRKRGGVLASVQDTAQAVIHEDYTKSKALLSDAAKSKAYLYPIRGIIYFGCRRSLWKPLMSRLGAYIALSVGVTASLFFLTYLPQLTVLVFVNGPLAVFSTVLLVLNESAAITNTIARGYLLEEALLDTFDGTLVAKGQVALVSEGREVKPGSDPMARLGKILKNPFAKYSPKALVRYLMYLPLNFIPVIGTIIFVVLQARARGRQVHDRYFQLKKRSSSWKSEWVDQHTGPCTAFGLVATLLEMVPLVSIVFSFTNTVGAALWASDIETRASPTENGTAPSLREAAKNAE